MKLTVVETIPRKKKTLNHVQAGECFFFGDSARAYTQNLCMRMLNGYVILTNGKNFSEQETLMAINSNVIVVENVELKFKIVE